MSYREEARFFWDKQEKRWKEEQEARSKLMADTLATLQLQASLINLIKPSISI